MLVDIDHIPDSARVWIFPASRLLKADEIEQINRLASSFIETWTAHNKSLHAAFKISNDHFLVFAVDETTVGASGCSLDKLHHFVKGCEQRFNIRFFDRLKVLFPVKDGVKLLSVSEVEEKILSGEIKPEDEVFDTTIVKMDAFRHHFVQEVRNTWLTRYLTV